MSLGFLKELSTLLSSRYRVHRATFAFVTIKRFSLYFTDILTTNVLKTLSDFDL